MHRHLVIKKERIIFLKSDPEIQPVSSGVAKQSTPHKAWLVWLAVVLAVVLLYFSLRGLDWQVFWLTIKQLNYAYLPLFFGVATFNHVLRAARWRILVLFEKSVSLKDVFWANMAGYFGNNLLPARAGELIRAIYLGKLAGINPSFVLATGLVERLMDIIALVVIGSISLAATGIISAELQSALFVMSMVGVVGLLGIFVLAHFSEAVGALLVRLPFLRSEYKITLARLFEQFVRGVQSLARFSSIFGFIILTALIWLLDGLQVVGIAMLFDFPFSLAQSLVLLAGLGLSSAIPSTPGYVGVYQFVAVMILVPFGLNRETAIAFMLVLQITGLVPILLWGGISMWKVRRMEGSDQIALN